MGGGSRRPDRGRSGSLKRLKRGAPRRTPEPTFPIVCEGEKTETQYFESIRKVKRLSSAHIKVVGGDKSGTHPCSIVQFATDYKDSYDTIWCVFDRDEHENIEEAFTQARDNGFRVAFSNPCFELWLLLHYQCQGAMLDRRNASRALRKHIPRYQKSTDVYDSIKKHFDDAKARAVKLRKQHDINADACEAESPNPSTWVDQLVEQLLQLKPARAGQR